MLVMPDACHAGESELLTAGTSGMALSHWLVSNALLCCGGRWSALPHQQRRQHHLLTVNPPHPSHLMRRPLRAAPRAQLCPAPLRGAPLQAQRRAQLRPSRLVMTAARAPAAATFCC